MRREVAIGAGFVATLSLILAVALCLAPRGFSSRSEMTLFGDRTLLLRGVAAVPDGHGPLVAWFGDSTILSDDQILAYPDLITHVIGWPLRTPNFDPYGYYLLLEPVLAQHPAAVVFIANLRVLGGPWPKGFTSLADQLPLHELPRAALLPWYGRSVSLPRLLVDRASGSVVIRRGVTVLDGLRGAFQRSAIWQQFDAMPVPELAEIAMFFRGVSAMLNAYNAPLTPGTPTVQMLHACVRRAVAAGARVLVIVPPIPIEPLLRNHLYNPATYAARIHAIRSDLEGIGAEVLDLHDYLAASLFGDLVGGHPSQLGHQALADRIRGDVLRLVTPTVAPTPS